MSKKVSEKYIALIHEFPLRPIETDADLGGAMKVINGLVDRGHLTNDESAYLTVLSVLVETFEKEHYPIEHLPPSQMLAASIEAKGVTLTEVHKQTGISISTLSALINERREFNVSHVEKLCAYFGLGTGAFIQVEKLQLTR